MHEPARLLAADPALAGDGDAAVERDRDLVGHERAPPRRPRCARPRSAHGPRTSRPARPRRPPRRSTSRPPPAFGVRVERAGHDPRDPGREHGLRARRRRAVVRARLHRQVERRPARPLAGCVRARSPRRGPRPCARASPPPRPRRRAPRRRPPPGSGASSRGRARPARAPAPGSCEQLDQAPVRAAAGPRGRRSPSRPRTGSRRRRTRAGSCPAPIPPSTWIGVSGQQLAQPRDPLQRLGHERLAGVAGNDAHAERDVRALGRAGRVLDGRVRVERDPDAEAVLPRERDQRAPGRR